MILSGTININKRLRQHPIWQRPDYGWAWVDVLMLANDRPRTALVNGEPVNLQRGQMAWSIRTLEREWGKSGEWINHFLQFCKDNEMVRVDSTRRRTIITVLNYSAYNPPQTETETDSETDSETATEPVTTTEQKVEVGIGSTKGEGEAQPPPATEIPSDEAIRTFCAEYPGDLQRGIPASIPEVWWSGWVANRLLNEKKWPRDWQRVLVLAFRADFLNRHPKAIAGIAGPVATATNGVSASVQAIQTGQRLRELKWDLEALENEAHADRLGNLPYDAEKIARLKKLRAEVRELERQAA